MVLRVKPEKLEERERVTHSLLRATLSLAAVHGFSGLGLREVARAAGIAPTSFYRHFSDMEQLGLTLIQDLGGKLVRVWMESVCFAPGEIDAFLDAVTARVLPDAVEDPELIRFLLAERAGASPVFRSAIDRELLVFTSTLGDAIVGPNANPAHRRLIAEATLSLVMDACADVLHRGPEHLPLAKERLSGEIRLLLRGAGLIGVEA